MIRYIYIGDQINDEDESFAFFDTIPDRFVTIAMQQVFDDKSDLIDAMKADRMGPERRARLIRLIPVAPGGTS